MNFTPLEIFYLSQNNFVIDKKNKNRAYKSSKYPQNLKEIQMTIVKTQEGYYKEFYDSWNHPYPPMRSCILINFNDCLNLTIHNFYYHVSYFNKETFLENCREAV